MNSSYHFLVRVFSNEEVVFEQICPSGLEARRWIDEHHTEMVDDFKAVYYTITKTERIEQGRL